MPNARVPCRGGRAGGIVARQQADQIIDPSIAYFAQSLGDEVASIHADVARAGELGYAGGLLSRLAGDARANLGSDVDTSFIDALRPAFVVQGARGGEVPSIEAAATGSLTRWVDPPGGPGMRATIDWAARTVRLTDSTGRAAARYELPTSFWGAEAETPFGAVAVPGGAPIVVMADSAGQLWLGAGGMAPRTRPRGDVAAGGSSRWPRCGGGRCSSAPRQDRRARPVVARLGFAAPRCAGRRSRRGRHVPMPRGLLASGTAPLYWPA
jgi:hypothetical protein